MLTRSQIAACWVACGIAVCTFLAEPAYSQTRQVSPEARLACQMFEHANGMRPVLASALLGDAEAFPKLEQHVLALRVLVDGKLPLSQDRMDPRESLLHGIESSAKVLLQKPHVVPAVQNSLRDVIRESLHLVGQAQEIAAHERKGRQSPSRVAAAQQLPLLLESLSRNAGGFAAPGMSSEAIFDLGRNLNDISTLTRALTVGDTELKIPATSNAQQRVRLQKLTEDIKPIRSSAGQALGSLQEYIIARQTISHLQKLAYELTSAVQRVCHAPGIPVEPRS